MEVVRELTARLLARLRREIPRLAVNGAGEMLPHIVNLRFPGLSGEELLVRLDRMGICISPGSACAARDPRPSHVLKAMGLSDQAVRESVRISLGRTTTQAEISAAADAICAVWRQRAGSGPAPANQNFSHF